MMAFLLSACSAVLYRAGIDLERWRAGMEEKSLDVHNLRFSYLDGGAGANIVMLHGFGSNKDSWNRIARYMTDHYRVVAVDLPGHGDSTSRLDDTYDVQSQARRLALFVDKLGLQRFHIIGSSMGGAIAIHYTHLHSNHVMTMGLISSGGVMSPKPSDYMQKLEQGENPLLVRSRDDFDNMLKFVMVKTPYIPWFIKNVVYEEYMQRQAINERIFKDIATEEMVNMAFLPEIDIPVFILWGKQDRVLDVSSVGVFEAQLPDTYSVILDNTGHAPMVEAPRASADHYLHFLKRYER
jgi:pimeloyl-ACP methyl ester carboxylesterase